MATASDRQRRLRSRRKQEARWRQLNLWVSIEVFDKLKSLSTATGKPQREVLHDLLLGPHGKQFGLKGKAKNNRVSLPPHQLTLFSD